MGREVKRVALDFDWPIGKTWTGFLNPHYTAKKCGPCDGSGYSPAAKYFKDQWYGYVAFEPRSTGSEPFPANHPNIVAFAKRNVEGDKGFYADYLGTRNVKEMIARECRRLADECLNNHWSHHLSQADVDALVDGGRLSEFTHRPRTAEQAEALAKEGGYWMNESNGYRPTAKEVNEWAMFGMGHDSINQWICVEARCKREGLPEQCDKCQGHGDIWPSEADKQRYESWEKQEPPSGPGYQIWETVSEGSPISPVFSTPEELARWMVENADGVTKDTTFEQWVKFISEVGWAPSMVGIGGDMKSGVQAVTSE